jgi:ABC-type sulfate transport system permease component
MSTLAAAPSEIATPRRAARRRRRRRIGTLLLLLPGAGYIAIAMIAPLLQLALGSVGLAGLGAGEGFSLAAFGTVLANPMMRAAFLFSLRLALATTALSVVAALALAALLMLRFPGRRLVMLLYKLPLVVPSLIAAFLILTMIGPGGMGARLAMQLGLGWPQLVHDRAGIGVILVLLWHQIPVTLLILLAVIGSIPPRSDRCGPQSGRHGAQRLSPCDPAARPSGSLRRRPAGLHRLLRHLCRALAAGACLSPGPAGDDDDGIPGAGSLAGGLGHRRGDDDHHHRGDGHLSPPDSAYRPSGFPQP